MEHFHALLWGALHAHWERLNQQLGVADLQESTEHDVTIKMPGCIVDDDGGRSFPLCLRNDDFTPPGMARILGAERKLETRYPDHNAPAPVADRYNALLRRDKRLVSAYNSTVDRRNVIIDADCE